MLFDPKHLASLEVIRQEGSLTRAAARLTTSQPALSRLLADMELRLGGEIFDRSTRPWRLTMLGAALTEQGGAILRAQDRAASALQVFRSGGGEVIRVGGTPFFVDGVLSALLARFQSGQDGPRFDIIYGYGEALLPRVTSRELDLAIVPQQDRAMPKDLHFEPLIWAQNVIACRAGHPLTRLTIPRPLALLDYSWVMPPEGSPLAQDMRLVLADLGMKEVRVALSGGSLASVLSYLQNSDALAVLPQSTVEQVARSQPITAIPIATPTPRRRLGVVTLKDGSQPRLVQALVSFLTVQLA